MIELRGSVNQFFSDSFFWGFSIADEMEFNVYIKLGDVEKLVNMYQRKFWENFIDFNSKYFQPRTLPFIEMVKRNLSKKERRKILRECAESFENWPKTTILNMQFIGVEIIVEADKIKGFPINGNKEIKEAFMKNSFQKTEFYKLFGQ